MEKKNIIQKQTYILVTKLHFVTQLKAKLNFARKNVPKFNLGTRYKRTSDRITQIFNVDFAKQNDIFIYCSCKES